MTYVAIFALTTGFGMIGQWAVSYKKNQIPELDSEPIRIWFHIAAEFATALMLIISAMGLLSNSEWGQSIYLIALGMLFYTTIVSPGYFAQQGQWKWLGMFAVLIVLGCISLFFIL